MYDLFYIICVDEESDWWQLRDIETHIALSAGKGKEIVLNAILSVVKRCKNKRNYIKSLNALDGVKVPRSELQRRNTEYTERGRLYKEDVNMYVHKAMDLVKEEAPVLKNRKLLKIHHVAEVEDRYVPPVISEQNRKPILPKVVCKIGNIKLK